MFTLLKGLLVALVATLVVRTKQTIDNVAGVVPTYNAAAAGDQVQAEDDVYIHVKNASGAPITVTIPTPGKTQGIDIADPVFSVAATTGERIIGPLRPDLFGDPASSPAGLVSLTWSSTTSVTWAVLELPRVL